MSFEKLKGFKKLDDFEKLEQRLLDRFNECQVIEGDEDLQTHNPNNSHFLCWLDQCVDEDASAYLILMKENKIGDTPPW